MYPAGDVVDFLKVFKSISAQAIASATTVDGSSVDTTGYDEAIVVVDAGTFTGASPSAAVIVEDSADDSTFAAITGAAFTAITTANDVAVYVGVVRIPRDATARYIRASVTTSGTITAIPISVTIILAKGEVAPAQTPQWRAPAA